MFQECYKHPRETMDNREATNKFRKVIATTVLRIQYNLALTERKRTMYVLNIISQDEPDSQSTWKHEVNVATTAGSRGPVPHRRKPYPWSSGPSTAL